jgi:hypothetical protein
MFLAQFAGTAPPFDKLEPMAQLRECCLRHPEAGARERAPRARRISKCTRACSA